MLLRANATVFVGSFCVMVVELIAARILAPYIGVSLYTWTSIIGVILSGIALGNYLGGKVADRYPSPLILVAIFLTGSVLTISIPLIVKLVANGAWFRSLPLMLNFTLRTFFVFFFPAVVLSMVSPLVIKLTLADLGRTGGIVGTIYAVSTVGSIFGTFMTGFYFILLFGIRTLVWLVGGVLLLTGIVSWFVWKVPSRWKPSLPNVSLWAAALVAGLAFFLAFQFRAVWQEHYVKESSYYNINVVDAAEGKNMKVLILDRLVHSYVIPDDPLYLQYGYLKIFVETIEYLSGEERAPRVLHLGGGGYSLPRYLETVHPESTNDVVEIDPMVTYVAQQELGLSPETNIRTYNQDARLYLMQRGPQDKYDVVVGDVFNDFSTPYHLTTLEFAKLVKENMRGGGVYMVNIIDDFQRGRYMPSLVYTLMQVFDNVYLLGTSDNWQGMGAGTFVIIATDKGIDLSDYKKYTTANGTKIAAGYPYDETKLEEYVADRGAFLLTDDYAPTDILVAPLIR